MGNLTLKLTNEQYTDVYLSGYEMWKFDIIGDIWINNKYITTIRFKEIEDKLEFILKFPCIK
jgi:hypothetical protein